MICCVSPSRFFKPVEFDRFKGMLEYFLPQAFSVARQFNPIPVLSNRVEFEAVKSASTSTLKKAKTMRKQITNNFMRINLFVEANKMVHHTKLSSLVREIGWKPDTVKELGL